MPVVEQDYWDTAYQDLPLEYKPEDVEFKDLFLRYLPKGGECFEVGCYPGHFLVYLAKTFDYVVHGIDATPYALSRLPAFLADQGVKVGNIYQEDFLQFLPDREYDVVCSFGFVEHFENFDDVLERHIRLVKPSGFLVIACPNFRRLQWLLHRILDPINLKRHSLAAMDLSNWRETLEKDGMKLLYHGFYRTADFWIDVPEDRVLNRRVARAIQKAMKVLDQAVSWPNPWLSPYMISISRKDS